MSSGGPAGGSKRGKRSYLKVVMLGEAG